MISTMLKRVNVDSSISCIYSLNVLKLMYVIYVWYTMFYIENSMHGAYGSNTVKPKVNPIHYDHRCSNNRWDVSRSYSSMIISRFSSRLELGLGCTELIVLKNTSLPVLVVETLMEWPNDVKIFQRYLAPEKKKSNHKIRKK